MADVPEELDWVAARFECSASKIFDRLATLAEAAVVSRVAQLTVMERQQGLVPVYKREDSDNYFYVACERTRKIVRFSLLYNRLGDDEITISAESGHRDQEGNFDYRVTAMLDEAGNCRLQINGAGTFTPWQILRKTTEDVLFQQILR